MTHPTIQDIDRAAAVVAEITHETPCWHTSKLPEKYDSKIWLKREDRQKVRSYKIRGAYCKIKSLSNEQAGLGVVCASSGNHARGVAYSCSKLGIKAYVYMPENTPGQKRDAVKYIGGDNVEIVLSGSNNDVAGMAGIQRLSNEYEALR